MSSSRNRLDDPRDDSKNRLYDIVATVDIGDYDHAVEVLSHAAWTRLEAAFWNASHPMVSLERAAFAEYLLTAQLLWQKSGLGSIRPITVYRSTLADSAALAAALRILGKIYAGCNLAYSNPPAGFWRSVYSITGYVLARQRDEHNEFAELRDMCLQLWLMAWLNPLSLAAGRLSVAVRLVGHLSKTCNYSLSPPTHAGTGLAAADLMDDHSPMPFARLPNPWRPQLPVYVNAQDAAFVVEEIRAGSLSRSRRGGIYDGLLATGQAAGLTTHEVNDFVRRAVREFGQNVVREIPRIATQGALHCVVGLIDTWTAMQEHLPNSSNRVASKHFSSIPATILNQSEGGFLLRFAIQQSVLRAASLIALRGTGNEPWSLGVVRWLQDDGNEVLIGCEVLSNFAESRLIRLQSGDQQCPAMVFSAEGADHIFLPLGTAESNVVCQVVFDRSIWVLSAAIELGDDWELRAVLDTLAA
ncbi:MAG: hypothetical protein EAZ30_07040 [Betaproteobacteria bacterium]|nr:MAG: hypothetical protein EAZ30_07040 [Betaproteobacteria bacterium]